MAASACVWVQFGMEMYARFAHKVLWHEFEPGWALHKSHHKARVGPFEVRAACVGYQLSSLKRVTQCTYILFTLTVRTLTSYVDVRVHVVLH